jgi:aerobic carbon-monoxide dehydrogenase medium subunit
MNEFTYTRPDSVAAAVKHLRANGDARFIAGGQSLLGAMKLGLATPAELIDLGRVRELTGITVDGKTLRIGALTTHAAVAASKDVRSRLPGLAHLAEGIGDPAVRSRGTIGGSLANNDPAACYPAGALGIGATIETDRRKIAAADFFRGLYETALEPDEVIVAVHFPIPQNAAYVKFEQAASGFALVGVCVSRGAQGVRVAATGARSCAFRVTALEQALAKDFSPQACDGVTIAADGMNRDIHASPEYRAHLVGVLAKRAVEAALK